jgi:flagellar biosynthesis/type III secretory pathway chaperone
MMNQRLETIQNQIHQCEKLLHVYQNEHRLLMSDECRRLEDVSPIVEMKLRLMRTFDLQQQFIATQDSQGQATDSASRGLLRELARRIEQLLVIDRENEILIRRLLSTERGRSERGQGARRQGGPDPLPRSVSAHEAAHA